MTAFDIIEEYRKLDEMASEYDAETGEIINSDEVLKQLVEELDGKREEKLEAIEYLKRENKAKIQSLSDEIKRLQSRKQSLDKTNDRLIDLQEFLLNGEKVKTDKFSFSYRTTKSIEVPDTVNPDFTDWVNIKYTWDKTAIKKDILETGISFEEYGIKLVEKTSLSIR